MRTKKRVLIFILLLMLHSVILLAGFIGPCDPAEQDRMLPYAPPTKIHFVEASGFRWRPFVYLQEPSIDGYRQDISRSYAIRFFERGYGYKVLGLFNSNLHLFEVDKPARILLLGTDAYGRDRS